MEAINKTINLVYRGQEHLVRVCEEQIVVSTTIKEGCCCQKHYGKNEEGSSNTQNSQDEENSCRGEEDDNDDDRADESADEVEEINKVASGDKSCRRWVVELGENVLSCGNNTEVEETRNGVGKTIEGGVCEIRHRRYGFNVRQDNSEVKTVVEKAHWGWFNLGVDSLGTLPPSWLKSELIKIRIAMWVNLKFKAHHFTINDYVFNFRHIRVMFTNRKEKAQLLEALVVSDKDSTTPTYPQRIHFLWADDDKIFNLELAHTMKGYVLFQLH
ncbi:hypothetical protein TEA_016487 [Camellia sinensis var. sinensis]|uniref:Uncharacterized protein n=1 Tax=Camellia sinensis var. sinensis TaxID=542762 RepID=A0A4S4E4R8_CAMSN|nr:hypothetical protein TEA_016487 [Camellia sinensis var. sinensis]